MEEEIIENDLLEKRVLSVPDLNTFEKEAQVILNVENVSASVFKSAAYLVFRCTLLHILKNWDNPIVSDVVYISNSLSVSYVVERDNSATVRLRLHLPRAEERTDERDKKDECDKKRRKCQA